MSGKGMLRISEAASLGFHALWVLSRKERGTIAIEEIASRLNVSPNHLAKVLQRLARAGLVSSVRGPSGGFQLSRPPERVRLIDAYEAIEGPVCASDCTLEKKICAGQGCLFGSLLGDVHRQVIEHLTRTRLSDFQDQEQR